MKQPFIRAYLNNDPLQDISEYIEKLTHEDSIKKDNMIELSVYPDKAIELLDNKALNRDAVLTVQYGFLGVDVSPVHTALIRDIDVRYGGKIQLTIRALDKGHTMKKVPSNKIWNKMKSSDIAKSLAAKYGLNAKVTDTSSVWHSLPQGNKSDFHFLKYLAERETDGNYLFYIQNNDLFFTQIALAKTSRTTYTYRNDERLIMFYPKYRTSVRKGLDQKALISGIDPNTKKLIGSTTDASNKKNNTALGDYNVNVSNDGVDNYDQVKKGIADAGTNVVNAGKQVINGDKSVTDALGDLSSSFTPSGVMQSSGAMSTSELSNITNTKTKRGTEKVLTADLETEGDTSHNINTIITMAGVARRHSGNWFMEKIRHEVDRNGYRCKSELTKNAVSQGSKGQPKTTDKTNKTVGEPNTQKKKVRVYVSNYGQDSYSEAKKSSQQ